MSLSNNFFKNFNLKIGHFKFTSASNNSSSHNFFSLYLDSIPLPYFIILIKSLYTIEIWWQSLRYSDCKLVFVKYINLNVKSICSKIKSIAFSLIFKEFSKNSINLNSFL